MDMGKANTAIIRERIPIPTVDEVLENLNSSEMFLKFDLCLGFHQIELDKGSRDITTFLTHHGLFRYKRLSFGVNSAPEKYQQIVRQVVSDISWVQNIAGDLIVHGKNNEEHDSVAVIAGDEAHPQPSEVPIQDEQGSLHGTSSVKVRYWLNRRESLCCT